MIGVVRLVAVTVVGDGFVRVAAFARTVKDAAAGLENPADRQGCGNERA